MIIELNPLNWRRKVSLVIFSIIDIVFLYFVVVSFVSRDNKEAAILFALCVIVISAIIYEIASPRKYKCMRAVKGKMSFLELKKAIEQELFKEPLLLWSGDESTCKRHLFFSDNWVVMSIGDVDCDPICIPQKEVTGISVSRGELRGSGQMAGGNKFIVRFDTSRRWFLTGYIRPEELEESKSIFKKHFSDTIVC